jgi:hypothetical protein
MIITIGNNQGAPSIPVSGVLTIGNNTSCGIADSGGGGGNAVFYSMVFISFPLTGIPTNTTFLNINVNTMDFDIDFTNQLPVVLVAGSRVVIRKRDSSLYKIIYNDGFENYTFVNKKSEYIELYYNGLTWII